MPAFFLMERTPECPRARGIAATFGHPAWCVARARGLVGAEWLGGSLGLSLSGAQAVSVGSGRALTRALLAGNLALAISTAGCTTTLDSIGSDAPIELGERPKALGELDCAESRENEFLRVLGLSDQTVTNKIQEAFQQLFYGDAALQAFYFPMDDGERFYIWDSVHSDVRTEGMGLAMNIAVKLGEREVFDSLWRYSLSLLRVAEGPAAGYFVSSCDADTGDDSAEPCLDPYGMQQFAMALIFAHHRWGSADAIDYESDALDLLGVMREKEARNGGVVVDGVTNVFDDEAHLPYDEPREEAATYTRPAAVMPAYYHQWASVTGDRFWEDAAEAGRAYWERTAHPTTGLMPVRAAFDGTPIPGWEDFSPEGYRTQVNMALDWAWRSSNAWVVEESTRLVDFFAARADQEFCRSLTLDGATCLDNTDTSALPIVNGLTALAAEGANREQFIEVLGALPGGTPTGYSRYYGGLLYLVALMVAGGQYPVCDVAD